MRLIDISLCWNRQLTIRDKQNSFLWVASNHHNSLVNYFKCKKLSPIAILSKMPLNFQKSTKSTYLRNFGFTNFSGNLYSIYLCFQNQAYSRYVLNIINKWFQYPLGIWIQRTICSYRQFWRNLQCKMQIRNFSTGLPSRKS